MPRKSRGMKERNYVLKRRFQHRIALLFPSTYDASLSSLGYQIIYYYLNSFSDVFAERVISGEGEPVSIETNTPLGRFDLILATAHYELDYEEIVSSLLKAGIEPFAEKRDWPPLILGGPVITANPSPMAKIADAFFLGEFEASGDSFVNSLSHLNRGEKEEFLESFSDVRGALTLFKRKTEIARVSDLDSAFFPIAQLQNEDVEPVWGRSFMLETARGCGRGCLFCLEAAVSGPRRERSINKMKEMIEEGLEENGVSKVTFFSLSFFDSYAGDELLNAIIDMEVEGSIPSVRADAINEERARMIREIGQKTVAIAPETGKEGLRERIGKRISDERILEAARALAKYGLSVKLYYMFGLPGEEKEDLDAIASQVAEIKSMMGKKGKVKVSANPFIPKPLTPMWKQGMMPLDELRRRAKYIKDKLRGNAEVEIYDPRIAWKQYEININGEDAYKLIIEGALKKVRSDANW
jgi:radical SAM superfamily enzyme YgiQ (UPF0313 family)